MAWSKLVPAFFSLMLAFCFMPGAGYGMDAHSLSNDPPTFQAKLIKVDQATRDAISDVFRSASVYQLNTDQLYRWAESTDGNLEFNLKFGDKHKLNVSASKHEVRGQDFQVLAWQNGRFVEQAFPKPLHLNGSIDHNPEQKALITVQKGFFAGRIFMAGEEYLIERLSKFVPRANADQYVLYQPGDFLSKPGTCGTETDNTPGISSGMRSANSPFPNRCLDLLVVAENSFYQIHGIHTLNEIEATFNQFQDRYTSNDIGLTFMLAPVVIFDDGNPFPTPTGILDMYLHFEDWLLAQGNNLPSHDLGHLFSSLTFPNENIVGIAGTGTTCVSSTSAAVSLVRFGLAANSTLVAHEVAHNLGSEHDGSGNACLGNTYIMSASMNQNAPYTVFSSCTKDYFQSFYNSNGLTCSDQCGNNPVNCVVSDWSEFGPCSQPVNGIQCRTREILVYPEEGGAECPELEECIPCNVPNADDSDCDGVPNAFDFCDGGNDNGPCNATQFPGIQNLPANYLCGNKNDKVLICHNGNTQCVSANAVQAHLNHGDFLGPCSSCDENKPVNPVIGGPSLQHIHDWQIFPNPANGMFNVMLDSHWSGTSVIVVLDVMGRKLAEQVLAPGVNQAEFDLRTKSIVGNHVVVRLVTEEGTFTQLVVVTP